MQLKVSYVLTQVSKNNERLICFERGLQKWQFYKFLFVFLYLAHNKINHHITITIPNNLLSPTHSQLLSAISSPAPHQRSHLIFVLFQNIKDE